MEAVKFEEISIPVTPKQSFKAWAKDIHPNLLGGAIPVNTPVFLDLFGNGRNIKSFKLILEGHIKDVYGNNLYFISTALQKASEQHGRPFTYLYYIQFTEDENGIDAIVRGA
jgi:hypothetical protein